MKKDIEKKITRYIFIIILLIKICKKFEESKR